MLHLLQIDELKASERNLKARLKSLTNELAMYRRYVYIINKKSRIYGTSDQSVSYDMICQICLICQMYLSIRSRASAPASAPICDR